MYHTIKQLLRIKDTSLTILNVSEEDVKGTHTLVIHAKLSPTPKACPDCGCTVKDADGRFQLVKNGSKKVTIRFEPFNHLPLVMKLAKQRFFCRAFQHHWTAQTYFVNPRCFIANHIRFKIIDLLKERISLTLIAKLCHVSISTVLRILASLRCYLPHRRNHSLPKVLMVDEFRPHTVAEDKMSFICADGNSGELTDILPTRKLDALVSYFKTCPDVEQVEFLVRDMNAAYFQLIPRVFKNAQLVIDRFHIVNHLNKAFNDFRIQEMKRLRLTPQKVEANKLKTNWRYLLNNRAAINVSHYKTWRSFRAPKYPFLTETMMIDRLIGFSPQLKETYECFHNLSDTFREKEPDRFFDLLRSLPDSMDEQFCTTMKNLLKYEEGIRNAMIYPYSNGKIEAKNTHIKTLKRVSYGFKSFHNMKTRIFLMNGLIKIK